MPRRPSHEIRVTIRRKDGKIYLRHRDPQTGRETLRTPKSQVPSEAEREAGAWERELREGSAKTTLEAMPDRITWTAFRQRYLAEYLSSLSPATLQASSSALDQFEKHCRPIPHFLKDVTGTTLSQFAAAYRLTGVSEVTIANRLKVVRAALGWAKDSVKLISSIPEFPTVKRARKGQRVKPMKGRPVTDDEFERILAAVPEVVTLENEGIAIPRWRRFLKALWLSGLRLGEALNLSWDYGSESIWVDLTTYSRPMLIISADKDKGGQNRVYPVSPEFAEMLLEDFQPGDCKTSRSSGLVFPLVVRRSKQNRARPQISVQAASVKISEICREAKVFTHFTGKGMTRKEQPAGAHDLRRSFGTRWARRVRATVLQQMMRHEEIETTMRYYVGIEAEDLAGDIYAAYEATKPAKPVKSVKTERKSTDKRQNSPANSPATNKTKGTKRQK